jgi:ZIP family zinc transporter
LDSNVAKALIITTIAGISTTLGSLLGLIFKKGSPKFMSFVLGFTAGVMVGISFLELFPAALKELGLGKSGVAFLVGFVAIFIIDYFMPHDYMGDKEHLGGKTNKKLFRTGLFIAIGVGIHNFPEGIATFYSSIINIKFGIPIAVAIAIHNIPEGLAVSAPIYEATGSRPKAFLWSFLSGVAEPVGALLTLVVLYPFLNFIILNYILAGIAGIMIYISLDELMPVSKSYGFSHIPVLSFIAGMVIILLSLILLQ